MIKLSRSPAPSQLTPDLQADLTASFKKSGESVWNQKWLKDALLSISHKKCCYCEVNISDESKYMEVDHFYPKHQYKDLVMEWKNLLPSCKRCNGTKNNHDTQVDPIIDPTLSNPQQHLMISLYRFYGKDILGKTTISVLNLNESDRLVKKRYEVGNAVVEKLEDLNDMALEFSESDRLNVRKKKKIINGLKGLLREGTPSTAYSATVSTIIMDSQIYPQLKEVLIELGLWDDEMIVLENELLSICLRP